MSDVGLCDINAHLKEISVTFIIIIIYVHMKNMTT